MGQARHPPPPGLGAGARPGSRPDQHGRTSEAPDSRRFGRAAGSPASQLKPPAPWPRAPRPSGPRAQPVRGARPAGPRARRAHLSGCAAFLRRCRRLLPVSAAGSDLWNHHTSPARCCSAAAAPPPPQPPLFVPPSSATASAAPTGHRYALPPSRPPASPSALRPLPPSPPRRRRRLHRRRRRLLRAPLVFIESKQASWRRPRPPASEHPDRRRRSNIPAAHWPPLPGATIRRAAGGSLPKPRPPAPLRAARRWAGPALSGAPLPPAPARSRPLPPAPARSRPLPPAPARSRPARCSVPLGPCSLPPLPSVLPSVLSFWSGLGLSTFVCCLPTVSSPPSPRSAVRWWECGAARDLTSAAAVACPRRPPVLSSRLLLASNGQEKMNSCPVSAHSGPRSTVARKASRDHWAWCLLRGTFLTGG
ncbi:uncharacterized protein [Canis lupus baileyi]|uniref:uncharacterized protein n=1 Tax=Canis lupus baileyi TaxID=143281 RepID=UPI003B974137